MSESIHSGDGGGVVRVIPSVMTLVPVGAHVFHAHRVHVEGGKDGGFVICQLGRVGRGNVHILWEALGLAILVEHAEIMIKGAVLLKHENYVIHRFKVSLGSRRRSGRRYGSRAVVPSSTATAPNQNGY